MPTYLMENKSEYDHDRCHCTSFYVVLVINNTDEFGRITGLRMEDWENWNVESIRTTFCLCWGSVFLTTPLQILSIKNLEVSLEEIIMLKGSIF